MIAAYLRVSSKAQDLAMQRSAIERAARARGVVVETWYSEKRSARTIDRPELERLRADARAGFVGKLFLFRLDRLTRSGVADTFAVVDELRTCGVEIVSLADGFTLDGPAAEVILAVLAWAAKMERLAINERIAAARLRLEEEGRPWGRPSRIDESTRLRARQLRSEGHPLRVISQMLKLPKSTVARAVAMSQNPAVGLDESPKGNLPKSNAQCSDVRGGDVAS